MDAFALISVIGSGFSLINFDKLVDPNKIVDVIIDGPIGSAAYDTAKWLGFQVISKKLIEVSKKLEKPVNEHIQRSVHKAFLDSTAFLCEECVGRLVSDPSIYKEEKDIYIKALGRTSRILRSESAAISTQKISYELPTAFDEEFAYLMANHDKSLSDKSKKNLLNNKQKENIKRKLLTLLSLEELDDIPPLLTQMIEYGWINEKGDINTWFRTMQVYFAMELKKNHEAEVAYNSTLISNISISQQELRGEFKDFTQKIEDFNNFSSSSFKYILENQENHSQILKEIFKVLGVLIDNYTNSLTKKLPLQNVETDIFINAINDYFYTENDHLNLTLYKLNKANKVCLVGMPGVGKTYIAKKIAYELSIDNASSYEVIWWIDADDKKIDNEFMNLASELFKEEYQIWSENKISEIEIIENVKRELELRYSSWLIIFDNAKDYGNLYELEEYAKKYFPKTKNRQCRILLTSRNKEWQFSKKNFEIYPINTWHNEDVKKYIEFPKNGNKIEVETPKQLGIFGGLPLAIAIAKQYILSSKIKNRLKFSSFYINWIEHKNKIINNPSYQKTISENHDDDYLSFLTTIKISYDALTNSEKEIINLLACFAPDKLPIEKVFEVNLALLNSQEITKYDKFIECLIILDVLSLTEFDGTDDLNSMHRLVQDCILIIQGQDQLIKNYRVSISLLAKSFKEEIKDLLISHVDTLADVVLIKSDLGLNIINNMQRSEKEAALQLFVNAGKYHFETGDIRSAEIQYKSAIDVAVNMQADSLIDESRVIDLKKSLANILFLKGKSSENKVTALTNEINQYYERNEDIMSLVTYKNDVINKILQRQCRFDECEETLKEIEKIVTNYTLSIEQDLYKYMVQWYIDNDSSTMAEKLSGIYHNLGSLYWTWGRQGDYEKSAEYFVRAIDFQTKFVSALEDQIIITNDVFIRDKLQRALNNKNLYLNVSRMIYGAVLGLLENFTDQWRVHQEAFTYFNSKIASEKRRYAYTSYYKLSYSWDRESLAKGLPEGFDENSLISDIHRYDGLLIGYDEKYDVIKKIVRLRVASKKPNLLEPENAYSEAAEAYTELWKQLESMKYDKRYYDVDTCSVSAFLDYAQYVKKINKDEARLVVKQALAIINGVVYPRMPELKKLAKELDL